MREFDIKEELKKLPECPGVYLMHDAKDEIIYVGKAINLKNRVRSYFQSGRVRSAKIERMIGLIAYFEYIICDSEMEALVLENNLIKEYAPKYNTMLTDDKTYPFIKVTVEEAFPRIMSVRQVHRDKARYFGPYTGGGSVKKVIDLLQKTYHLRNCNLALPKEKGKERGCLYYQMKQCDGPCIGAVDEATYKEGVAKALAVLEGDATELLKELDHGMREASERLDFEHAAELRDLMNDVRHITERQRMTDTRQQDRDMIAIATEKTEAVVSVFFVRDGKLIGREHFHLSGASEEHPEESLEAFVKQYYAGTPYIPNEILMEYELPERELLELWLGEKRGGRVHILQPQKGEKAKLLKLAKDNANLVMHQDLEKIKREEQRTKGAADEIASLIGLPHADRMEAFDISHISGVHSVASMVVFEQGKPKRNDYRKFKLRTVQGPDDYKSMEETLTRRFRHGMEEQEKIGAGAMDRELAGFHHFPDLILMDGGKGQVNVALKVLEDLGLSIPVCGMVKDDHHRTRGLYYNNQEIPFPPKSDAFDLITRIQDEAHRFAIEYHRKLRGQAQVHSVLDEIPGIGETRRKALMQHFQTIDAIRNATEEELKAAPRMDRKAALSVYSYFHPSENATEGNDA